MSGLLVKSTVVMKKTLITLNERHLAMPVILGGAALNRRYVEQDLRAIYKGQLFYGEDAFDGLRNHGPTRGAEENRQCRQRCAAGVVNAARTTKATDLGTFESADHRDVISKVYPSNPLSKNGKNGKPLPRVPRAFPRPPIGPYRRSLARAIRTDFDMNEVFEYLNELTLFSTQWQFRKGGVKRTEYEKQSARRLARRSNVSRRSASTRTSCAPASPMASSRRVRRHEAHDLSRRSPYPARGLHTIPAADHGDFLCLSDYIEPARDGLAID